MPLTVCPSGQTAVIKKIGGKETTRRFLESLGFTPGAQVVVVSENAGHMIVSVKDTRVALDKALAQRILV